MMFLIAILFAVVIGVAWLSTGFLTRRAERRFPPLGRRVDIDDVVVHYVERGTGRPVVFLHGAFGGLQDFVNTVFDDVSQRHRAIAIDRPGHGYSRRPPRVVATPRVQARLVERALDALEVEDPILVGFSYGATVALAHALLYPGRARSLVLINGALYDWGGSVGIGPHLPSAPMLGPLLLRTLIMPLGLAVARRVTERAFAPLPVPPSFERSPVALALRPSSYRANAEDLRVLRSSVLEQSRRYSEVEVPTILVVGEGDLVTDPAVNSRALKAVLPRAEMISIPEAGHQVLYTHPEIVVAAVEQASALAMQWQPS